MQLREMKRGHSKIFGTQKFNLSELESVLDKKPKIEAPRHHLDFFGAQLPPCHDFDQSFPKSFPIHLKYEVYLIKPWGEKRRIKKH